MRAPFWRQANEVRSQPPTFEATQLALDGRRQHGLGRKRILDTPLSALPWTHGVRAIITSNPADFWPFGLSAITP